MSASVVVAASATVPPEGRALDANGIVGNAELSTALKSALDALALAAAGARPSVGVGDHP
jgi:hypothetical protein